MTDAAQPTPQKTGSNPTPKLLLIAGLTVALLLPLMLILDLVGERAARQQSVVREIGALWGHAQRVGGPILAVPARRTVVAEDGETRVVDETIVLLPDDYRIDAEVRPETRRRGLFEAVVYRLDLTIAGHFTLEAGALAERPDVAVDWSGATLVLGLSDQRSVRSAPAVRWDGETLAMAPGLPEAVRRLAEGGMQVRLPGLAPGAQARSIDFEIALALNGSEQVGFLPLGRSTAVAVRSDWPHPSFFGSFLPGEREIGADGFAARWRTSYFARAYPQVWPAGSDLAQHFAEVHRSAFGVRFVQPVDAYQRTERTVKYGVLFIVFTFTALFLFESVAGVRIHIVHYALVGLALALFYMLVLALAEQIGFTAAYALGAVAVVAQIAFYTAAVLASARRTGALAALLALLYAGLWGLMQLEDHALLVGALALFAALTAVMAVARRVDWYRLAVRP